MNSQHFIVTVPSHYRIYTEKGRWILADAAGPIYSRSTLAELLPLLPAGSDLRPWPEAESKP